MEHDELRLSKSQRLGENGVRIDTERYSNGVRLDRVSVDCSLKISDRCMVKELSVLDTG